MVANKKFLTDYPYIAKEWNFQKNKTDIEIISYGSSRNIWWKCKKGHEFLAVVANRHQRNKIFKCPQCKLNNKI